MDREDWDIQEVKQLKKKELIQLNLAMLLIFVFAMYFAYNGNHILIMGMLILLIWIGVAFALYTFITGRNIGTKVSKRLQEFERGRKGDKRWKRRKITDAVIIFVIGVGVGVTVVFFVQDFNSISFNFYGFIIPFIMSWIVFNIKGVIGIRILEW